MSLGFGIAGAGCIAGQFRHACDQHDNPARLTCSFVAPCVIFLHHTDSQESASDRLAYHSAADGCESFWCTDDCIFKGIARVKNHVLISPVVIASILCGCEADPVVQPAPPVKTADSVSDVSASTQEDSQPVASERQAFDGLKFIVPSTWREVALSDFQKGIISARFEMPEAGPESTLTLSRASGGVESNLDRWRGQFQQSRPERAESLSIAGRDATLIDLEGEFSPGFGKEATGTWRMIGMIVPLDERAYFMKLTGPVDEVSEIEEDFLRFAKSAVTD